jgi:hypothetical protein
MYCSRARLAWYATCRDTGQPSRQESDYTTTHFSDMRALPCNNLQNITILYCMAGMVCNLQGHTNMQAGAAVRDGVSSSWGVQVKS